VNPVNGRLDGGSGVPVPQAKRVVPIGRAQFGELLLEDVQPLLEGFETLGVSLQALPTPVLQQVMLLFVATTLLLTPPPDVLILDRSSRRPVCSPAGDELPTQGTAD